MNDLKALIEAAYDTKSPLELTTQLTSNQELNAAFEKVLSELTAHKTTDQPIECSLAWSVVHAIRVKVRPFLSNENATKDLRSYVNPLMKQILSEKCEYGLR